MLYTATQRASLGRLAQRAHRERERERETGKDKVYIAEYGNRTTSWLGHKLLGTARLASLAGCTPTQDSE
jgi:hypothetical protein